MNEKISVLDHGYVQLVTVWGSDQSIIESARMSTDKGFLGWGGVEPCKACAKEGTLSKTDHLYINAAWAFTRRDCKECAGSARTIGDERLLKYLYTHKHSTPFEFCGMTVEVQCPIFVLREWHRHRHRTQSYSELSARYTPLPDVNYVPTVERIMMQGGANKQAQGTGAPISEATARLWIERLTHTYTGLEDEYQAGLSAGVPKELARLCIPVGRYSRMRASANLRNWLQFLTLRMDEAAQWEIRQYANVVGTLIAEAFPRTWELFDAK